MTCTVIDEVSGLDKFAYPDSFIRHPNIRHTEVAWSLLPNIESDTFNIKSERFNLDEVMRIYRITYMQIAQSFDKYEDWLIEEHFKQVFKYSKRKKNSKNLIDVKIATYY